MGLLGLLLAAIVGVVSELATRSIARAIGLALACAIFAGGGMLWAGERAQDDPRALTDDQKRRLARLRLVARGMRWTTLIAIVGLARWLKGWTPWVFLLGWSAALGVTILADRPIWEHGEDREPSD